MRVVAGITNSFLNHAVNNILLFPLRDEIRDFGELWIPSDAFWEKWEGRPTYFQSFVLILYILLFGLGVAVAWQKNGWLGFLPLILNLLYNLWTSIALLSGQRFMLAMDWSVYLYFMIGIYALFHGLLFHLHAGRAIILRRGRQDEVSPAEPWMNGSWRQYSLAGLIFLGLGACLPLSEKIFPKRYPQIPRETILGEIESSPGFAQSGIDPACFHTVTTEGGLSVIQGRALYPRYYSPGDGETFTDAAGYKIVDYGRLVFEMVGQADTRVVFPVSEVPDLFPNASDVTVISNSRGEAWFVHLKHSEGERLYSSDVFDVSLCDE
jgi:hypothetical protein